MSDKNDEPFGCVFFIVVIIAIIVAYIVAIMNGNGTIEGYHLAKLFVGIAGGLYGIVYYLIKKFRK